GIGTAHATVVAAQHLGMAAVELLDEDRRGNSRLATVGHVERQSGETGHGAARSLPPGFCARGKLDEIVGQGVALGVPKRRGERLALGNALALQVDRGKRRQSERPRKWVVVFTIEQ